MPKPIYTRVKCSIPPFDILIEEHSGGWDVAVGEKDISKPELMGTFNTLTEAESAAQSKVKGELNKQGKELPSKTIWTTTRMILPPEPAEGRRSRLLQSTIFPIIITVASILLFLFLKASQQFTPLANSQAKEIPKLSAMLTETRQELDALKKALGPSSNVGPGDVIILRSDVDRLRERFGTLEMALGDSLDRRMAVPLMRKDLDAMKEQYRVDLAAVESRLTLVVDFFKWFLGLTGIGGAISVLSSWFFKPKVATETTGKS